MTTKAVLAGVQHPQRYVWDFWYTFESRTKLFHVFYLNADPSLVPTEQHHHHAQIGYARTYDFIQIDWGDENSWNIITPPSGHWANASIWSGDVIKLATGYLCFFTSRTLQEDDGMTQKIGIAYTSDFSSNAWTYFDTAIRAQKFYTSKTCPKDLTIHAWRDPFLFRSPNDWIGMLLCAKSSQTVGEHRGAIALLTTPVRDFAKVLQGQQEWTYHPPILQTGWHSEMEVPQIYQDKSNAYQLVFSCWGQYNASPTHRGLGGLFHLQHSSQTLANWQRNHHPNASNRDQPQLLLSENQGLYACRIVPELNGEMIGFDHQTGGIRRSGRQTHWQSINRDFTDIVL